VKERINRLDTLVFYIRLYFALRSGMEHRKLRFNPPQIELLQPANDRVYVSKTNQGGLTHREHSNKLFTMLMTDRCLVRLYKLYMHIKVSTRSSRWSIVCEAT